MAPIPKPQSPTKVAIQKALEDTETPWESVGVSAGDVGVECDRAIWLAFRRASEPEKITWQKRRIFERGNIEEDRLIELLRMAGLTVTDQQAKVRDCGGHLRGKIDGQAVGVIEAPATEHIVECKSSKEDAFKAMVKNKVKVANPKHYATMQFYMHGRGLARCLYIMSNKNDEDLHIERVEYDADFAIRSVARISRIIQEPEPPARLCGKRDDFRGMFCRQAEVCWGEKWPRVHCRTCLFSTPLMGGDAAWDCARFAKPLSLAEQAAGCPAHLFVPALVPGEQTDVDEENETISYRLADGRTWTDGAGKDGADIAAA